MVIECNVFHKGVTIVGIITTGWIVEVFLFQSYCEFEQPPFSCYMVIWNQTMRAKVFHVARLKLYHIAGIFGGGKVWRIW